MNELVTSFNALRVTIEGPRKEKTPEEKSKTTGPSSGRTSHVDPLENPNRREIKSTVSLSPDGSHFSDGTVTMKPREAHRRTNLDTLLDLRNWKAPRAWRVFSKRSPTASMLPSDHPPWPRIVLTPLDSGSSRQSSDILDVIVPLFRSNMRLSLSRDICFSSIAFVFHESFDQQRLLLCSRIENFGQDVATYSGKG
ncbi:hypothetical protein HZH68_002849 [Vespula germanica]|uniref:Uncharacterized protein n=1 Tax=Vespula germanica TaxID=30212 RepID=A0A834U1H9_VESGE|nr:hypothetical protein HZH68_002849 [Vespula germanica]